MHFLTHVSIANALYKKYSTLFPIAKHHFIYGNIKPDLKSNGLAIPHTLENTIYKTCSLYEEITNETLDLYTFSVKLGEICHYLCDYFCYYHISESDYRRYSEHFIYEIELHLYWLWKKDDAAIKETKTGFPLDMSMTSLITRMRKDYSRKSHDFIKDVGYSLSSVDWLIKNLTLNLKYHPNIEQSVYLRNLITEAEHENSTIHGYL
ncbi:MAG: zinc dependent phospholipase C family protein [Erysipelothrix sp.]|nr:zinc dependent phospholipase C family protein [Erysipelothrix sp.]